MTITTETKIFLGIIVSTVVIIAGGMLLATRPASPVVIDQNTLAPSTAQATGSATPMATLVEFSDYQCPACKTAEPIVESLLIKYPSTLKFVYRNFPLPQHPFGQKSAYAAEAAGAQGKFWQYHAELFRNQDNFSDDFFPELASKLGLDLDKFKEDMNSPVVQQKVSNDLAFGNSIGINSTPTFFLNGKKLDLQSLSDLQSAVQDSLK